MTTTTKQMSPVDSAWLHVEDPTNLMMLTGVSLLDKPIDFERFRSVGRTNALSAWRPRRHDI